MSKRAAVINDLSSFGSCSLTAYIAVLSALGVQPCPLPTAVLSAQSEFPVFYRRDLTADMPLFLDAWQAENERFDAICTGYFSDSRQIDTALRLINDFRTKNSLVIIDPVMGDEGSFYPAFDGEICEKMRSLAAKADILLPNLTELCFLSGADYAAVISKSDPMPMIEDLAKPFAENGGVVVTGIHIDESICNLAICGNETRCIARKRIGERFSGTGDLFSAVISGCVVNGKSLFDAAETAADFVCSAIDETVKKPHDPLYGVRFEQILNQLTEVKHYASN